MYLQSFLKHKESLIDGSPREQAPPTLKISPKYISKAGTPWASTSTNQKRVPFQLPGPEDPVEVLGKGKLPKQPDIVKAKFFSKSTEEKIKGVGGACVLHLGKPVKC